MKPISLRAYSRHRGCSLAAVQEARDSGRLVESLTADGKISDAALADREWDANTREDRRPITGPAAAPEALPTSRPKHDLQELRARELAARAELMELELGERKRELVPVAAARADVMAMYAVVKTRLLAVPSALAQRLSCPEDLKREIALQADDLIRAALDELSLPRGAKP